MNTCVNMFMKGNIFIKYTMVSSAVGFVTGAIVAYRYDKAVENEIQIDNIYIDMIKLGIVGAIIMPAIPLITPTIPFLLLLAAVSGDVKL